MRLAPRLPLLSKNAGPRLSVQRKKLLKPLWSYPQHCKRSYKWREASATFVGGVTKAGSRTENTVRLNGLRELEWPRMLPPCFSMICLLTHRPRPVPVPSLVVKRGSNMREAVSGLIPLPLSDTEILIRGLPVLTQVDFDTRSVITPSPFTASMLLSTKFENTWRSSPATPDVSNSSLYCFTIRTALDFIFPLNRTIVKSRIEFTDTGAGLDDSW